MGVFKHRVTIKRTTETRKVIEFPHKSIMKKKSSEKHIDFRHKKLNITAPATKVIHRRRRQRRITTTGRVLHLSRRKVSPPPEIHFHPRIRGGDHRFTVVKAVEVSP